MLIGNFATKNGLILIISLIVLFSCRRADKYPNVSESPPSVYLDSTFSELFKLQSKTDTNYNKIFEYSFEITSSHRRFFYKVGLNGRSIWEAVNFIGLVTIRNTSKDSHSVRMISCSYPDHFVFNPKMNYHWATCDGNQPLYLPLGPQDRMVICVCPEYISEYFGNDRYPFLQCGFMQIDSAKHRATGELILEEPIWSQPTLPNWNDSIVAKNEKGYFWAWIDRNGDTVRTVFSREGD